tara:strand:+ start:256 stop:1035 length:780 start_codon:yes stop_codon:yes gene_type:complete
MATKQPKLLPMEIPGPQFIKRVKQWEIETGQKYTPPKNSIEARIWKGDIPMYNRLDRNQAYTYEDVQDFEKERALVGEETRHPWMPWRKVKQDGLYQKLPKIIEDAKEVRKELALERLHLGGGRGIPNFDKLTEAQYGEVERQLKVEEEIRKRDNKRKTDPSGDSSKSTGSITALSPGSVTQYSVPNTEDVSIKTSFNTLPLNLSKNQSLNKIPARLDVSDKTSVKNNKALISTLPELEEYPEYFRGMDQLSLEMRGLL